MAARMKRRGSKARPAKDRNGRFHAFWSGSLGFGLVNVRVLVFPASRFAGIRLHLISREGSLLRRRFYCPREQKELSANEIVRGYELDDGAYVTVEDKELEALEPEKTQEIALQKFVPLSELPPLLFERGYYLTPQKEAVKAYRLLADVMEHKKRAGIATFVMHDREYVVAIFGRDGILCAQTLRFHDEIRDPAAIGLPDAVSPPKARVTAFERTIDALSSKVIPRAELDDDDDRKLRSIIQKKVKLRKDLIEAEVTDARADREEADHQGDLDLLETIRRSLR